MQNWNNTEYESHATCIYLLHVTFAFRLNINIYLFTYSKWCQQKHMQSTTCIYLFMQITPFFHVPFIWILISICLLIQIIVNRTSGKRPPVFVYLCKILVLPCDVRMNIQYLFVYLFKSMSTQPHASDHLYLFIYAN